MPTYKSLTEAFDGALASTARIGFVEGAEAVAMVTPEELRGQALALLQTLQESGLRPGAEVIIYLDDNRQFLTAFWACVFGGMVPVPVALGISDEHRFRLLRIFTKLERPTLCSDSKNLERLESFAAANDLVREVALIKSGAVLMDEVRAAGGEGERHLSGSDDVAFIQFSSGSTSAPKGVVLTHGNLLANIGGMIDGAALSAKDTTLSWVPLTHDMGIIGFHLVPLVAKIDQYVLPTSLFIRRPLLWMRKASELKASMLCSPNFGFEYFLKAYDKHGVESLDLSCVRLILNGGEPISVGLCQRFSAEMASHGLSESAMYPVYGLAEASVSVTLPEPGAKLISLSIDRNANALGEAVKLLTPDDPAAVSFPCVGRAIKGCEVRITDEAGSPLAAQTVGHIEIRGDNVTKGYYVNPEADRAVQREQGWLDTGDLGFVTDSGLVVTGRFKEIIFCHGQNFFPHDLESILQRECGIALGRVVVAGYRPADADSDALLVYVLHKGSVEDFAPMVRDIRAKLNAQTGLEVAHVVPVAKIPKTTSGKIQRHLMIQSHLRGEDAEALAVLEGLERKSQAGDERDLGDIEEQLKALCNSVLIGKNVGSVDNLFEIGTSSVELAQIHEGIDKAFPGLLDVTDLFDYPTITELAGVLKQKLDA